MSVRRVMPGARVHLGLFALDKRFWIGWARMGSNGLGRRFFWLLLRYCVEPL
jgi:hypothetical protein